jgi:hypothetical protein
VSSPTCNASPARSVMILQTPLKSSKSKLGVAP